MTDFAVILAAGASTRLGRAKQLVELDGEPLVARAVRTAREAGLEPVVVTGAVADAVLKVIDAPAVHNDDWAAGVGGSIAVAVRELEGRARTITIMLCDQPGIEAADLAALHEALRDNDVSAAAYADIVGVPAVFAPSTFGALAALRGDQGARRLLRDGAFRLTTVDVTAAAWDIDEPKDLEEIS